MKTATIEEEVILPAIVTSVSELPVRAHLVSDLAELVKARLTFLVLVTTTVGYYLGSSGPLGLTRLAHTVFGTALAAAGAAALNQWWERAFDALMHRTRERPIPGGRMSPASALGLGAGLSVSGVVYLFLTTNLLSASLAATTVLIYLLAYTPLKRISTANTLVGAIPGALPPMIGWAAARGTTEWPAWSLFAILFCWQMPHFFAIAWMYREDYARAGFRMLSGSDLDGTKLARQAVFFAVLLILVSCLPAFAGLTRPAFLPVVVLLSSFFAAMALRFALLRDGVRARQLFIGSIVYLPLLLLTLVLTRL